MSQATLGSSAYRNSSLFSGYYLDERIADLEEWECDSDAQDAFDQLQQLWELEGELVPGYKEDELLDSWIDEVISILGFGTQSETTVPGGSGYNDRLLFESEEVRRDAAKRGIDGETEAMYGMAAAVLEAKQWDADFSKKFNEQRSYRDASHQIKYYLERTPERLQWGILTDGKKWRLYGTKDYATEVYYEVDLPELLEAGDLEEFKYFYAFFRPEAFREIGGTTFLDRVWNESETAAQELGEDLQDNVFTALRVLGEGFIHTNDLDIDPDDEEARAELKEQSLVLLYRLMFVLYAESRGLIHPDDPAAQEEYDEHFSLDQIRLDVHDRITSGDSYDDWSGYATQIWGQLEDLFGLVDEGQESLGIPPYNGGLFDEEKHTFLAENEVADRYIAEVIHRLGTTEGEDGNPVIADYADLDTRHLGSIYEGLLEHEFRIASEPYAAVAEDGGQVWKPGTDVSVAEAVEMVEEGELYVVNDDGERKATGAYYTPDYVVNYIVEETIDPLLDDIRDDLEADGLDPSDQAYFGRFYSEVQDLKILDPAMGSAHFLTSATAYLTEQVMELVREQERQGRDEQAIRRTIAKECIYGVDVNGMAVELGKLSMWLETLAADKPLAFLDHHVKTGNSLVGSDISEVLSDDTQENGGQLTLTQAFAHARQQTLGHVMDLMEDLLSIDNDDLADIKSMEEIYDEIRDDPLYQRLFEIANVHTAEEFGLDVSNEIYEEMARAIENEDEWDEIRENDWFQTAQVVAKEQNFFHWELEFPEVFFASDGTRIETAGFDAIIGNPPYINIQNIHSTMQSQVNYFDSNFEVSTGQYDIYTLFCEMGMDLRAKNGVVTYIMPNKFFTADYGEGLRSYLCEGRNIRRIVDFGTSQIFHGLSTYTGIFALGSNNEDSFDYVSASPDELKTSEKLDYEKSLYETLQQEQWIFCSEEEFDILEKIEDNKHSQELDKITERIFQGVNSGKDSVYVLEPVSDEGELMLVESSLTEEQHLIEKELLFPILKGKDIRRYYLRDADEVILYPYNATEYGQTDRKPYSENELEEKYPNAWSYLNIPDVRDELKDRDYLMEAIDSEGTSYSYWYEMWKPRRLAWMQNRKLLTQVLAKRASFALDSSGEHFFVGGGTAGGNGVIIQEDERYIQSLLNSRLTTFYLKKRAIRYQSDYFSFGKGTIKDLPIIPEENCDMSGELSKYSSRMSNLKAKKEKLNLNLLDYLGNYSEGKNLSEVGLTQPPRGTADSILQSTTKQYSNLRIGSVDVIRVSKNSVEIQMTARYKPENLDEGISGPVDDRERDRWGYVDTDPEVAIRITDLTKTEADLLVEFIPVAADEENGFANFREEARKSISLVDRLRKLTLPAVNEVRDGLESYIETKERAEELDAKIEKTDELIDEIVYELYGLTDEEIEIVEEAVSE